VQKRGNERIEHHRFPLVGRERAALSVTDKCRGAGVMEPRWNLSSAAAGQYCLLARIKASYPQLDLSQDILIFHQFNSGRGRHQYNQHLASII
jgi:hypothetical protein